MIQLEETVFRNGNGWNELASQIAEKEYSKVFILVDENTEKFCLPVFYEKIELEPNSELLQIASGEKHKNIDTSIYLWNKLSKKNADRNSLIINLGGGMISDLGGFVASTYKRGVDFVNIPTTLLGMVDASIGGKNGIDFGQAKNQIGTVNLPKMVVVENDFLKTLPQRQLISGMAEMIKHSLIQGRESWDRIKLLDCFSNTIFEDIIWESIGIKQQIVAQDPFESGLRKTLNYGHTLGHAIESHCLENPQRKELLHGEAIAIGIILATHISNQLLHFPEQDLLAVSKLIMSLFPHQTFTDNEIQNIIDLTVYDKKNRNGKVLFVLLSEIGRPKTDCIVNNDLVFSAFEFYKYL